MLRWHCRERPIVHHSLIWCSRPKFNWRGSSRKKPIQFENSGSIWKPSLLIVRRSLSTGSGMSWSRSSSKPLTLGLFHIIPNIAYSCSCYYNVSTLRENQRDRIPHIFSFVNERRRERKKVCIFLMDSFRRYSRCRHDNEAAASVGRSRLTRQSGEDERKWAYI